jgi:hypothetical protein
LVTPDRGNARHIPSATPGTAVTDRIGAPTQWSCRLLVYSVRTIAARSMFVIVS